MRWRGLLWLLLLGEALASTHIFYPRSALVEDGSIIYMGKVGLGHVLKIIIDGTYPEKIVEIHTDPETKIVEDAGRYYIYFVPQNMGPGGIKFYVEKNSTTEVFTLTFDVVRSTLDVDAQPIIFLQEFSRGNIKLQVFNTSLGSTDIRVVCPRCGTVYAALKALEPLEINIPIFSDLSGRYPLKLRVEDLRTGQHYTLPFTLVVLPTLRGRMVAGSRYFDFLFPFLQPFKDMVGVVFWRT